VWETSILIAAPAVAVATVGWAFSSASARKRRDAVLLEAVRDDPTPSEDLKTRVEARERAHDQLHGDYRRLNQKVNKRFFDEKQETAPTGDPSSNGGSDVPGEFSHLFER